MKEGAMPLKEKEGIFCYVCALKYSKADGPADYYVYLTSTGERI